MVHQRISHLHVFIFPEGVLFFLFALFLSLNTEPIAAIKSIEINQVSRSNLSSYQHAMSLGDQGRLFFHWNDPAGGQISMSLKYYGKGWIGFAVSPIQSSKQNQQLMVGSDAVIGIPETGQVQKYDLMDKNVGGVLKDASSQTLVDTSIVQDSIGTTLSFVKILDEPGETNIEVKAPNTFLYAYGTDNSLGYHMERGTFVLNFAEYAVTTHEKKTVEVDNGGKQEESEMIPPPSAMSNGVGCQSDDPIYQYMISPLGDFQLLRFYWSVGESGTGDDAKKLLSACLKYSGKGWLAWGVSSDRDGAMIGTQAVMGFPGIENTPSHSNPGKYIISDKSSEGIELVSPSIQTLQNASIVYDDDNGTELIFTKFLEEPQELKINADGINTFVWAVGMNNMKQYHKYRGIINLDLSTCEIKQDSVGSQHAESEERERFGWIAHGLLATLAWAFAAPFAISAAIVRSVFPSGWFYVHMYSNITCLILTLAAFTIAVANKSRSTNPEHFTEVHHIVGLGITIAVALQVASGFIRPQAEHGESQKCCSKRNLWEYAHKVWGGLLILLSVWQVQDGMSTYSDYYGTIPLKPYYLAWIVIFICLVVLVLCLGERRKVEQLSENTHGLELSGMVEGKHIS